MPSGDELLTADQRFLDEVFDHAVAQLEEGQPVDIDSIAPGHEQLRPQIERTIRLALQVAVGQTEVLPTVPGYIVLREIGHGGMGAVYLAQQERLGGRPVALKMLPPSVALSPQARSRFRSEALAIARLRHPNIVAVYDVVEEAGVHAFAMEWVEGLSLAALVDRLHETTITPKISDVTACLETPVGTLFASYSEFICGIGIAIADALAAVHREGLLHRDVKPSNVLLRHDGTALLSDFGLARSSDESSLTLTGCFVGTPAFAAPEQLRGENNTLDARTDVYGLGATLYYALTGTLAVRGTNAAQILRQIESADAKSLCRIRRDLPVDLATIIDKAVAPDRERRYATADELAADLRAFRAGDPIRAKPPSLTYVLGKRIRRHRVPVALGLVLVLTLGGLGARAVQQWWSVYEQQFRVEKRGPGVQSVDVAILGKNVPTSLPADTLLQVNELHGLGENSEFPGGLGIGHERGRHPGHVLVSAPQQLRVRGELQVGCGADGLLAVENGGALECDRATLGPNLGSRGEARITSAGASFNVHETLDVGSRGPGVLTVGPQARVTARQVRLGQNAEGDATIAGEDASLSAESVTVGEKAPGHLEVHDGGSVSCVQATLAVEPDARVDAVVSGRGAHWTTTEDLYAGWKGSAEVSLSAGGRVEGHNIHLGHEVGSVGSFAMNGSESCVRLSGWVYAGCKGTGRIDIQDGDLLTGDVWLGVERQGNGQCSIRGRQLQWVINGIVRAGAGGAGVFEIRDGAQVDSLWGMVACWADSSGRIVLSGQDTTWRNRASCAIGGWLNAIGGNGEIRVDNGATFLVEHELLVWPSGKLRLVGGDFAAEILTLSDPDALEATAGILGARTVRGDLRVSGATLASACAPGAIEVDGDLTLESGSLRIVLSGRAPDDFDRVEVSGSATLGGQLEAWIVRGFEPDYDDRFTILSAAQIAGAFDNVSPVLHLRNGGTCEVLHEANQLILTHFRGPLASHGADEPIGVCLLPIWEPPTTGPFPGHISRNTTAGLDRVYLGPPDDISFGVANGIVDFDFGTRRVVDGPGPDFNVYERDGGPVEFQYLTAVSVSDDGLTFVSVKESEGPLLRVPGDEEHGSDDYGRSYDLAASGLGSVRFIRVAGRTSPEPPEQAYGFDLDAIGAIHFTESGALGN